MAEIFKNFTDNPWFWATVALSGLMLINHLVTKAKKTLWHIKKLLAAFLITTTGFVNTAIKTMENFSTKIQRQEINFFLPFRFLTMSSKKSHFPINGR